jgi:TP901-1 family phage major tail protein
MAASKGNNITLTFDGTSVSGLREKGISIGGDPIDISDDNSSGWQELMEVPAKKSVTISCSGVTKDETILALLFGADLVKQAVLTFTDTSSTITGDFFITGFQKTAPYDDATTYSFELQSSGAVVYATV